MSFMKHVKLIFARLKTNRVSTITFLVLLITFATATEQLNAQVPKQLPSVPAGAVNAGSVLSQFMNAIKPTSFNSDWTKEKSNWLSAVGKIKDAPGMISNITSLAKFIKPAMFKNGFNLQSLMQTASTAKTMTDAAGLLKNLEGGMKPDAMASGWAGKKDSWLSALSLLK